MLQITKRTGATPQQLCEFQTNQTHKVCLTHSQLCQVLDYAMKIYGLDTCLICPDWNMSRSRTTSTLQIQNERELHPSNTGNYKNEQGIHHSNTQKCKASESCTTATLWTTGWTRATSRQDWELQNEQERLHSDTTKHIMSKSYTTAKLWI